MPPNYSNPYSSNHTVQEDGSVTFTCTTDPAAQVWLSLPPHHPVVIQTQAFWTAVGASVALEGLEATQWSALTWLDWVLGDTGHGHAATGVYRRVEIEANLGYQIELFNKAGALIVTVRGRGVVFRNRNFEEWREGSKNEARKAKAPAEFAFASREELGLADNECPLVGPLAPERAVVDALVTAQNGLAPGNPLIGGSGDHVNSTHIGEVARQAVRLLTGRKDIILKAGSMTLNRYVELGTPFGLLVNEISDTSAKFTLEQLGRECSVITAEFD